MSISFDFTEFRFEVADQFVDAARCLRVCRYLPRDLPLPYAGSVPSQSI